MKLRDVYEDINAKNLLYWLLEERPPEANISHKRLPSWASHLRFVESKPYPFWYLIYVEKFPIGAVYLTEDREIGIAVLKKYSGKGIATKAIKMIMKKHPGTFKANIAPHNGHSMHLFKKLGYKPLQYTYIHD